MTTNITDLWRYICFLEERISRARKQGKDTTVLQRNRSLAMQQITALREPTPNPSKQFEAVTEQI